MLQWCAGVGAGAGADAKERLLEGLITLLLPGSYAYVRIDITITPYLAPQRNDGNCNENNQPG